MRERERESVCVCIYIYIYIYILFAENRNTEIYEEQFKVDKNT